MTPPDHFPWLGVITLILALIVVFGFGTYVVLTW